MQIVLAVVGGIAGAVLLAASAAMNFLFARSLGHGDLDGLVLGIVSVALDLLKAVLAVLVARAARDGRRSYVIIGGTVFCLITLVSLAASIGFTSSTRSARTSKQDALNTEMAVNDAKLKTLRAQMASLPVYRAQTILDELLVGVRQDRRWQDTKECNSAASQAGRTYCEALSRLRVERATAIEAQRLADVIAREEKHATDLRLAGAGAESDPQSRVLAAMIGLEEAQMRRLLASLVALVVEITSGLAIYLMRGSEGDFPSAAQEILRPTDQAGVDDTPNASAGQSDAIVETTAMPSPRPRPRVSVSLSKGPRVVRD